MPGPVHWHEGLFLQPHHLQTMQHHLLERIDGERRLAYVYPYGVIDMKMSADALENMLVRFDRLRVVMPSGLEVNFPDNADMPSLDIQAAFDASSQPFTVLLAVPLWYSARANALDMVAGNTGGAGATGGSAEWRVKRLFKVAEIQRTDENTGENAQPMMVRRINARLILADEDQTDLETVPLLRIAHSVDKENGKARQEDTYYPPSLVIGGSADLMVKLRNLVNLIQASRSDLAQRMGTGAFLLKAMQGEQIEQQMRLRTLNRYSARLGSLIADEIAFRKIRPFDFYLELRELLGELSAAYPAQDATYRVAEYDHDNLNLSFDELVQKIRDLIGDEGVQSYEKIPFIQEGGRWMLQRPLTDDDLQKPTEYYLGITTRQDYAALAKLVEDDDKFKFMSKSLWDKLVRGVKLKEQRHPPSSLPALLPGKGAVNYFRLQRSEGKMWERIAAEKMGALRWPDMQTSDYEIALYMTLPLK